MMDSCSALKLEAALDGMYLMSRALMTSSIKSDPGIPGPAFPKSAGTAVSAAACAAVGRTAEGVAGAGGLTSAACAGCMAAKVAALPATTPPKNWRRAAFGFAVESSNVLEASGVDGFFVCCDIRMVSIVMGCI